MTIKELIDKYGGVPEFKRMLDKKKNLYSKSPSYAALYKQYETGRVKSLKLRDLYRDLGVDKF